MRQEAQLEELKKRIAATARKAGLEGEFETLEKSIKVRIWTSVCDPVLIAPVIYSTMLLRKLNGGTKHFYRAKPTRIYTTTRTSNQS